MPLIIGNVIALVASLLMVYSGIIKKKEKVLYVQSIQIGLYVIRESSTDQSSRKGKDYYLIDKKEKDDFITIRYYDKDAYNFVRELDCNLEFLELDDYEKAGIIPDEEVVVQNTGVIDFAHNLITPFTTGIGSFDDTMESIIHPAKQKTL